MSSEFYLPDEILAVIPTNPYEQLDVAKKITAMAISSRVSDLEMEVGSLRDRVSEQNRVIENLREEAEGLKAGFRDADARATSASEENVRLGRDKEMLSLTVKRLNRDMAKLENFKRQLMQTLSDDKSSHPSESKSGYELSSPKVSLLNDEGVHLSIPSDLARELSENNAFRGSSPAEQMYSLTPYISPKYTPAATPKVISSSTSPRKYSSAGSPKTTSGVTTPTHQSIQQSAANSSSHARSLTGRARVDGKEFFKRARSRLSYEQFGSFLANLKEFNGHRQSREETLKKAEELFGTENRDLYSSFYAMLNPNLQSS